MPKYWLYKTEPSTYSLVELEAQKKTNWDQIRNYQARNYLKLAQVGDRVVIYHSGDERAAVGIAEIVRTAYADIDPEDPKKEWVQVDIRFIEKFRSPVLLADIKLNKVLSTMPLVKQSRLSAMPISSDHFKEILNLAKLEQTTSGKKEKKQSIRGSTR